MRFGAERAPLEMTKFSSIQVIRVCPHCNAGNEVGKNWFSGNCRGCGKMFNRDNALIYDDFCLDRIKIHENPDKNGIINKEITAFRAEMEERACIWADEQAKYKKTGQRTHGQMSEISKRQYADIRNRKKSK